MHSAVRPADVNNKFLGDLSPQRQGSVRQLQLQPRTRLYTMSWLCRCSMAEMTQAM